MNDYEKTDVFQRDLTRDRARLEELKRIEGKQKAKKYPISNGYVMTACPERWEEFIKK